MLSSHLPDRVCNREMPPEQYPNEAGNVVSEREQSFGHFETEARNGAQLFTAQKLSLRLKVDYGFLCEALN